MAKRTAWLIAAAVAAVVYVGLWVGFVQGWAWLRAIDTRSLKVFYDFGVDRPNWVRFWQGVSLVFGPHCFQVAGLALTVIMLPRRDWRTPAFLLVSIGLADKLSDAAKALAHRPRPSTALVEGIGTSFPSGHALCVVVGVFAILTIVWPGTSRRQRRFLAVIGLALIALVGLARVVLNVHNPSDVVAGWALGLLYFLLCWIMIRPQPGRPRADSEERFHRVPMPGNAAGFSAGTANRSGAAPD